MSVAIDGLRRDLGQLDLREAAPSVLPPWPAKKKYVAAGGIVVDYPADLTMHRVAHGVAAQASSLPLPAQPLQRPLNWRRWLMISLGAAALLVSGWGATHLARSANLLAAHAAVATPTTSAAKTTAKPAPAASPTAQQLQAVVNQAAAATSAPTSIVTIDLSTGATASHNANLVFTSASIYKLFVADAIYQGIDAGTIHYTQPAGATGNTVATCLNYMITVSSNPCGEALGGIVGWDSQNAGLHAAGFTHTLLRLNASEETSAGDVALLLQKLYSGQLVSPASTSAFIGLLKAQKINNRLPAGLPAGTVIAHKTGDLYQLEHDAGIVYTPKGNYIVVGMTGPWQNLSQAPPWFANLSRQLYNTITQPPASKQ